MPTAIEWCDETFNPWWGCEKVSPGCAHCYAEGVSNHRAGKGNWGAGHGFRFFGDKHWEEPLRWARNLPAKLSRRPRVFCASMADVFEERDALVIPRERLFDLIEATAELDWLLLTKRPENVQAMLDDCDRALPSNVWLGASIENARYTWRADVLREIPAAVRFISAEPLLESLFDDTQGRIEELERVLRRAKQEERAVSAAERYQRTLHQVEGYLAAHPEASANHVHHEIGGRRQDVLRAVRTTRTRFPEARNHQNTI